MISHDCSVDPMDGLTTYHVGLMHDVLALEMYGGWLIADGQPVNSLWVILKEAGMTLLTETMAAQIRPDERPNEPLMNEHILVDMRRLALLFRPSFAPTGALSPLSLPNLTEDELRRGVRGDNRLRLWVGEDFGLKEALEQGRRIDPDKFMDAICGERIFGGLVQLRSHV